MTTLDPMKVIDELWSQTPVPIFEIIERLGMGPVFVPMDDDLSGWIERRSDGSYQIAVNSTHAQTRQRFTAAHELGHYIYHRDLLGEGVGDNRAYRTEGTGRMNANIRPMHERQANSFAANVLMPRHILATITDRSNVDMLATMFNVSPAAMRIRLGR